LNRGCFHSYGRLVSELSLPTKLNICVQKSDKVVEAHIPPSLTLIHKEKASLQINTHDLVKQGIGSSSISCSLPPLLLLVMRSLLVLLKIYTPPPPPPPNVKYLIRIFLSSLSRFLVFHPTTLIPLHYLNQASDFFLPINPGTFLFLLLQLKLLILIPIPLILPNIISAQNTKEPKYFW
jgi:hypothetical protein